MNDMDWADKIADSFYMGNGIDIAAALRKAKADGMREAAGLIDGITTNSDEAGAVLHVYWKRIFNAASKLQPPH